MRGILKAQTAVAGEACLTLPNPTIDAPTVWIFIDAFSSRPLTDWQDGQRHCLTDRCSDSRMWPHWAHVFELGYHWSIKTTNLRFFLATHSRINRNSPSAKSLILRPQSRCIPLRFNVSKHNTSKRSVSSWASFQNQSRLWLAIFSYCLQRCFLACSRRKDPFCLRDNCLHALRMVLSPCWKNSGDSILLP